MSTDDLRYITVRVGALVLAAGWVHTVARLLARAIYVARFGQ